MAKFVSLNMLVSWASLLAILVGSAFLLGSLEGQSWWSVLLWVQCLHGCIALIVLMLLLNTANAQNWWETASLLGLAPRKICWQGWSAWLWIFCVDTLLVHAPVTSKKPSVLWVDGNWMSRFSTEQMCQVMPFKCWSWQLSEPDILLLRAIRSLLLPLLIYGMILHWERTKQVSLLFVLIMLICECVLRIASRTLGMS